MTDAPWTSPRARGAPAADAPAPPGHPPVVATRQPGWLRYVLRFARPYRAPLAGMGLLVTAQALVVMMLPWPTALAVDHVLAGRPLPGWADGLAGSVGASSPVRQLVWVGVALVVLALLHGGLRVTQQVWRRSLGLRVTNDVSAEALAAVQRQSPVAAARMPSGDLIQRIVTDARCGETLVFGVGMTAFGSLVSLGLLGGVVLSMSAAMTLFGGVVAAGMAVVARVFHQRMRRDAIEVAEAEAGVTTATEQMLASLPEIQAFSAEPAELARFTAEADKKVAATMRTQRASLGFRTGVGAMTASGTAAVLAYGGLRVLDGASTLGELLVVLAYLSSLFGPIEELAHLAQAAATARAGATRLLELERAVEPVPEPPRPQPFSFANRALPVSLQDVTFGYERGRPVIEAGETLAIVGPSGTGKSTLVGLLPRFYDPWSGVVRIAGIDVRSVSTRDLRRHLAVVRQDPLLLPVSVRANIAYGNEGATEQEIRRAAEHALAAELIEELPHGYDTVLAEGGATLSGGQRQRLAIARALCRDAPVLILDEPTAGLDAQSEAELLRLVSSAAAGRTVVLITHRLSSLRGADRIVVLDGTRIAEQGDHAHLMALGGVYARYRRMQSTQPDEELVVAGDGGRKAPEG